VRLADTIKFDANGLVPAAVTDVSSGRLLVLCFLDREALEKTLQAGLVHVFRRSQGRVALKGESSGHTQAVREVRVNCGMDSLEIRVEQHVAACHKGYLSCYYRVWDEASGAWRVVDERLFDPDNVYTDRDAPN